MIFSAVFSPDGKYILAGSQDHTATLSDVATGTIIKTFFGARGQVDSVAFSPDGKYVLVGSEDSTARLYVIGDVSGPQPVSLKTTLPTAADLSGHPTMNDDQNFRGSNTPGAEYISVTIQASQARIWDNGWCADKLATAQSDWKLITQRFLINNVGVPASQLLETTSTRHDGLSCVGQYTLLSGWKAGDTYTLITEQTFSSTVRDGSDTILAGKYSYVIYVTVK